MSPQFGYIRVSSADQNTDRQLEGIELDRTFTEKISNTIKKKPVLQKCLEHLRTGDTLHVLSMDRLAGNLKNLHEIIEALTAKGVTIKFQKECLEFTNDANPMSILMLQVLGSVAEFERSLVKEKQAEGIHKAKQQGKHLGRKAKLSPEQVQNLYEQIRDGIPKTEVAAHFGISRQTLYRVLKTHFV